MFAQRRGGRQRGIRETVSLAAAGRGEGKRRGRGHTFSPPAELERKGPGPPDCVPTTGKKRGISDFLSSRQEKRRGKSASWGGTSFPLTLRAKEEIPFFPSVPAERGEETGRLLYRAREGKRRGEEAFFVTPLWPKRDRGGK